MIELQRILCVSGVFSVLFLFSESIYAKLNLKGEISRKVVHISTGLISLLFPFIFDEFVEVAVLCTGFMIVLAIVESKSLLPSITNIDRSSGGSIFFPLAVILSFGFYKITGQIEDYVLPILLLTICDPVAAFVGKKYGQSKFYLGDDQKTFLGSFAFLISALIMTFGVDFLLNIGLSHFFIISLSIIVTLSEALSRKGADNLFIPLTTILILSFV